MSVSPPSEYTAKVFRMLDRMPVGATVRIDKVCKPENTKAFIDAIKIWIDSNEGGKGVVFSSDWTKFTRRPYPSERIPKREPHFRNDPKSPEYIAAVKRAAVIVEWYKERLKRPIPPFRYNGCEYFAKPSATIQRMITVIESSTPMSRPFIAFVYRLEQVKEQIEKIADPISENETPPFA